MPKTSKHHMVFSHFEIAIPTRPTRDPPGRRCTRATHPPRATHPDNPPGRPRATHPDDPPGRPTHPGRPTRPPHSYRQKPGCWYNFAEHAACQWLPQWSRRCQLTPDRLRVCLINTTRTYTSTRTKHQQAHKSTQTHRAAPRASPGAAVFAGLRSRR